MAKIKIALTITSTTALSLGAGGSAGTLADKTILRDGRGRPIIPGSHVKGKARHTAEALLRAIGVNVPDSFDDETDGSIRAIFGSPKQRSSLCFADLTGTVRETSELPWREIGQIRPSVAINRRRGTADDQRLLFQETALEGMEYISEKAITGDLDKPAHAALLWAALRLTPRWGGAKSRGLGWSEVKVQVTWDGAQLTDPELEQYLRQLKGAGA